METATAYQCTTCGKQLTNAIGLSGHMKSHKKDEPKAETTPVLKEEPIKETTPVRTIEAEEPAYNTDSWKELPPPIIDHLKLTYGNWLNHFEIGQKWKEDFGGYAMYIRIPERFSTEWKRTQTPIYDNKTRSIVGDKKVVIEDIRWRSLKDLAQTITWLDKVKKHVIDSAYRKGIQLPNTNIGLSETEKTYDDYNRAIAGVTAAPRG